VTARQRVNPLVRSFAGVSTTHRESSYTRHLTLAPSHQERCRSEWPISVSLVVAASRFHWGGLASSVEMPTLSINTDKTKEIMFHRLAARNLSLSIPPPLPGIERVKQAMLRQYLELM